MKIYPRCPIPDLRMIADELNLKYFNEKLKYGIAWTHHRPLKDAVLFGEYNTCTRLVTIDICLADESVPLDVLTGCVWHELVHAATAHWDTLVDHSEIFHAIARVNPCNKKWERFLAGHRCVALSRAYGKAIADGWRPPPDER